mmetsp:Transcript_6655/g.18763  ORF Transcript_6655/g.18763 Transcript_6655/m.18763 type:complete len:229 (+) Transcript_6655:842-1528(+)
MSRGTRYRRARPWRGSTSSPPEPPSCAASRCPARPPRTGRRPPRLLGAPCSFRLLSGRRPQRAWISAQASRRYLGLPRSAAAAAAARAPAAEAATGPRRSARARMRAERTTPSTMVWAPTATAVGARAEPPSSWATSTPWLLCRARTRAPRSWSVLRRWLLQRSGTSWPYTPSVCQELWHSGPGRASGHMARARATSSASLACRIAASPSRRTASSGSCRRGPAVCSL